MVFEAIVELLCEHTDCDASEVTRDTRFADLGVDSLDTVELVMQLEDKVDCEIELTEKVETVGELTDFVEKLVENK